MIELASIVIFGILAQWVAWRTKVPAILPLIIIGLLVGPLSTFFTDSGEKWIQPMFDEETQHGIFPGNMLFYIVSLSIGIILFEGGLTLKKKEIQNVGSVIGKLVSVGALITFSGAALASHYIMNLSWPISFLFSGLIIVTGPTVIAPILRNIPLNKDVAAILKWEGILIDPVGALVAVLVFEFISSGSSGAHFTSHAFMAFGKIVLIGSCIGFTAGYLLHFLIKEKLVPHYLLNVFTLALVMLVFVVSDVLAHESGLLSVVVMGMVLGNLDVDEVKDILHFKEALSVLLISILFILLSANIDMEHLILLNDIRVLILFLVIILVIRPLGVFLSSTGSSLSINEKLFISWVGPRGIVAAGIASLFGLRLVQQGVKGAEYITPLVFIIVLGTVLLNATTARMVARLLKVTTKKSTGILMVGANLAARLIAKYLADNGRNIVLLDTNKFNVKRSQDMGLTALEADIYNDDLEDNIELNNMGYLMAMTGSSDVNKYAIEKFNHSFGENGTFRLISSEEKNSVGEEHSTGLFSFHDDYISFNGIARDYPQINELPIQNHAVYAKIISDINNSPYSVPLFIKRFESNAIDIIPSDSTSLTIEDGDVLVYMGKAIDIE